MPCYPAHATVFLNATPPTGGITCAQRKAWKSCDESWMTSGNYCRATCGACTITPTTPTPSSSSSPPTSSGSCVDVTPSGGYSCAQQAAWGKCSEAWVQQGGFCRATCGLCKPDCGDVQPPGKGYCAVVSVVIC